MDSRSERVWEVLKRNEVSNKELARRFGISPQLVANWKMRGNVPDKYLIRIVEQFEQEDARWLITGKSSVTEKESLLLQSIEQLKKTIADKEKTIQIMEKYMILLEGRR